VLRSLDGNLAPPSWLRSVSNAGSIGTANPSRDPDGIVDSPGL